MNSSLKYLIEQLGEDNTTGSGEVVDTPYAFATKVKDPDDAAFSETVPETDLYFKKMDEIFGRMSKLSEISYKDYKRDDALTERQKINQNIKLINQRLREVEQMINHASRLKTESGATQDVFWKGTVNNFSKIKERLTRLSTKITEMYS